jgi:hypothetical protein
VTQSECKPRDRKISPRAAQKRDRQPSAQSTSNLTGGKKRSGAIQSAVLWVGGCLLRPAVAGLRRARENRRSLIARIPSLPRPRRGHRVFRERGAARMSFRAICQSGSERETSQKTLRSHLISKKNASREIARAFARDCGIRMTARKEPRLAQRRPGGGPRRC